jgi:hypothetical protein
VKDDGVLPFYRGQGGGRWPVVKTEEWPVLMGMKWLPLNWRFTPQNEGGRRGNRRGMQCGARGSAAMVSEARVALEGGSGGSLLWCRWRKRACWAG